MYVDPAGFGGDLVRGIERLRVLAPRFTAGLQCRWRDSGAPSIPDLTLLATGSSPLWIAGGCSQGQINQGDCIVDPDTPNSPSDNPSLTINGNLYVNANMNNAVKLTGKKNATKLFITSGGVFKILNPGGCSGCTHNTVTCAACTWVTGNQPYSNYSPALLDPLRFMTYPTSGTAGSCSGGTCNPGVYNSTLSLNSTTTLSPGVYILNNGIKVTGNNTKITGNGVMFFVNGGSFDLGGGSNTSLTPPTSGPYKNVLVFQSRTNTNALKITGGASAGLTFGGISLRPGLHTGHLEHGRRSALRHRGGRAEREGRRERAGDDWVTRPPTVPPGSEPRRVSRSPRS